MGKGAFQEDGSAIPPDPRMIEDGLIMKAPDHPLQFSCIGLYIIVPKESSLIHPLRCCGSRLCPVSTRATTSRPPSTGYEAGLTIRRILPLILTQTFRTIIFQYRDKTHVGRRSECEWVLTMKNNPALLDRYWN